ncbi:MAG: cysteine--tRNA ligase [Syntrophaceae bacterium]|nr:cysteine--tRNA ligase [Syntrophaceae bacterium]
MKGRFEGILETIGNTPLVEIRKLNPNPNVKIFAKLESFNPGGSVKDRPALYMIERAEERGELTRDKIILEATSGNTGIGLALVAAAKGYRLCLTLSEAASEERKKILKALGAELRFTPAALGTDGAIEEAYELMRANPGKYFLVDQFNNPDNFAAHYHGTAVEIWEQTEGKVTMLVATLGTSGTAMGCAMRLKEYNPAIRIVGVEPYMGHKIQGLKNMKESYRPGIFDRGRLDETVHILDEDAFEMARRLLREEGIFAGMSCGAAMHVAVEKAKELDEGLIVVILPDSAERYLSTELFADKEKSTLRLYNVRTKQKEFFQPLRTDEVRMTTSGPSIHLVPHLGSYRRFVVSDLIARYLGFKGYRVRRTTNIVDLTDKTIAESERAGLEHGEFTKRALGEFLREAATLRIGPDVIYPTAQEHVDAMLAVAEKLVEKGYAYEKLRSVYFDISKFEDYGKLSNVDLAKVQTGKTSDLDEYEKDSPVDFTLLKRSTLAELKRGIYTKTRWGNVRPSWHLACAALSMKMLGDTFDIHASGSDIVFPHCENVLAIGKALTGRPPANYWVNTDLVMVEGKKMSRSLGNILTVADLVRQGYRGSEIRYFLLSSHYRKPLNFSPGAMETARNTVEKLNEFVQRLIHFTPGAGCPDTDQYVYDLRHRFAEAMDDDLNISAALAVLFGFVKRVSAPLARNAFSPKERDRILEALRSIDSVLAVMDFEEERLDEEAQRLIDLRNEHRRNRKWKEADEIRDRLLAMGVEIKDTPTGTAWKKK